MKTLIFLIAFVTTLGVRANEITAKVVSVIDGNTIQIESIENGLQKIVIAGIDCPELEQEFGVEAKKYLEKKVLDKLVKVEFAGKDWRGNYLAVVFVNDDDVRVDLLKDGYAWTAEKNPLSDLEGYRVWAQKKGKGLWKNPSAIAPWTFRRQQSMVEAKSS